MTKKQKILSIRIDEELYDEMKLRAAMDDKTLNRFIVDSIRDSAFKEINIEAEELGALEQIRSEVLKTRNELKILSTLFNHYLKWFFAIGSDHIEGWVDPRLDKDSEEYSAMKREINIQKFRKADEYRKKFFKTWKAESPKNITLEEIYNADLEETRD